MFNVLQRFLKSDVPPNKVQEVKTDAYGNLQVLGRDDGMVFYGPLINSTSPPLANDKKVQYEIVVHRPHSEGFNTSFSIYRSNTIEDAEKKFTIFSDRIPTFVSIAKSMFTVNGLQKISDILIENPGWSIAHLMAYFNLVEHVTHVQMLELLDYPDHIKSMTPFQVGVKAGNIEIVKLLLPLSKMEHLDNNSNSVYHYASMTNKDMIHLLATGGTTKLNHCNSDGYTPLHLACLSDKPDCVNALLLAGADVNIAVQDISRNKNVTNASSSVADFLQFNTKKLFTQDMKYGGTPLHWSSSREVLLELIQRGCDINAINFQGRTALHVMVARNRLECCVALLSHEAEIDMKDNDGNTALHIAIEMRYIPIVQCLVVFGCDLNIPNRDGCTPRHMVGNDASGTQADMILYILHSVGAQRCPPSAQKCPPGCSTNGTYSGIPPVKPESTEQREHIHQVLAINNKSKNINLSNILANAQNLIDFERASSSTSSQTQPSPTVVDVTLEQRGQSVMDSLLGMFSGIVKAEAVKKSETPTSPTKTDKQQATMQVQHNRGRLLCMDGGGIRGLILVQMLLEIERLTQTPIQHLFDWIAGTSTGGILALGIGIGKTMKQCMCLYMCMKDQAFVGSRPYASDHLETLLKSNLGEFSVMSDIKHPKIMVTGVMADRKPVDLHLFRNYKCASDILGIITAVKNRKEPPLNPEDQLIWRAARSTGAAPSYFRSFGCFLDGGLIANNPTLDAMTEIHEYNMALRSVAREQEVIPISVVVSLGTGLVPVTELREIDVFRPDNIFDTVKLASGLSAIGNLLVDQATASDGRVVDRARAWCSMIGVPYFRFNPQMSEDIAMDEKNDQKLINMLWETKAYMYANRNKVIEMINSLN